MQASVLANVQLNKKGAGIEAMLVTQWPLVCNRYVRSRLWVRGSTGRRHITAQARMNKKKAG